MIVDTSVMMALLLEEPEQEAFTEQLVRAASCSLSAASWVELSAVLTRKQRADLVPLLQEMMAAFDIRLRPFTPEQARIGSQAYRQYGVGTQSKARLNFGDCFSYALARETGEPLLFKGDDFTHTDIVAASLP